MKGPAAESACGFAAINPHNLAGDEGRSLGGEKDDGVSDLVWLGAAFERHRGIERRILRAWRSGDCLACWSMSIGLGPRKTYYLIRLS